MMAELLLLIGVATLLFNYRQIPKIGGYLVDSIKGFNEGLKKEERMVRDINPKDNKDKN